MTKNPAIDRPQVLLITSDELGRGNPELGRTLMVKFLRTLAAGRQSPDAVLLLNAGVRLALDDSPVLEALKELQERGTDIRACTTCLNFFQAAHRLAVGQAGSMDETVEILGRAARVATL